jgi:glycosyltransferase involved in cell wall biosynthesis
MATRGYLLALDRVKYEWLIAQPDRFTLLDDVELDPIRHLMSYPKQFRHERPRVQPGDPRIGGRWKNLPDEWEVGSGTQVVKWDNIIREGDTDHDVPIPGPDEKWQSKTECIVLHFDPGKLARIRDALARQSGGEIPIVGLTAWETDRIPTAIAQQLSDLDALICPSQHTANAIRRSGLDSDVPIHVVPHALTIRPPSAGELSGRSETGRYVFYTIGTNIPRKNLAAVIAAYCRAFAPTGFKDMGLVVKTSADSGGLRALYRDGLELSKTGASPKIALYGEKWPASRIRELHLQSDCWVDATRGEGFGLPQCEAVIMGNPVITTNWGAQTEVIQAPGVEAHLVESSLVPVDEAMAAIGVYRSDQQWADPDVDCIAAAMQSTSAAGKQPKRLEGARATAEMYSLEKVGVQLMGVLDAVKVERR